MRKIISILLVLLFISSNVFVCSYAQTYETAEDAINDANSFLDTRLGIPGYYRIKAYKKMKIIEVAKSKLIWIQL